jgi:adenine-specific DNA methylase
MRMLEPSCGDGAILGLLDRAPAAATAAHGSAAGAGRGSVAHAAVTGVELDPVEAAKAQLAAPAATVIQDDFFSWFTPERRGAWDAVAGNPPFIRFGNWSDPARERALDLMRSVGLKPTKLTNAWLPFVVASTLALRPGGRLGLVIPAELLQVTYAAPVRAFLVDHCSELTVVTFRRLVFDGILQEVVLLLGVRADTDGLATAPADAAAAPAARIRVLEVDDAAALGSPDDVAALPHAPALRHDTEKWTKYFLPPAGIDAIRAARHAPGLQRLGEHADVDVGIVTGRNQFFVMRPSETAARGLAAHVSPIVGKSAQLRGIRFGGDDLARLATADAPVDFLGLPPADVAPDQVALAAHLAAGESDGVHLGYKCSIRKRWWVVPSVWTPDAFMLRQIHDHPRIVANDTAATSTDTIHRVRALGGVPAAALAAASINSATFAFSEVVGRSYGGGVLELEPREAEQLPIPDPAQITDHDIARVDELIRAGDVAAALDHMDRTVLVGRLGLDPALVDELRAVWVRLRDRRMDRSRRATPHRLASPA